MKKLRPAAQAVLNATKKALDSAPWQLDFIAAETAAAVLLAVADQVTPSCSALSESGTKQLLIRHELKNIAAELTEQR